MFKIELKGGIMVELDCNSPNEYGKPVWTGRDTRFDVAFDMSMRHCFGAFGHSFNHESTTPIDLHYAVFNNLADYDPVVVEGAELVETYDPGIPEGAIT